MLVLTILFMNGAALGMKAMAHTMGYEKRLFDNTKVHTVDIVMNGWDEFIANAASEEYHAANVVVDGEAYKNVGIRAKGNTSLSTVSSLDSERYSFKIEFDHYDSTKSYHGLDKLSLNNLIQDSTMMKDYLTYTMMNAFGVNSPLCSYVYITVNGEDWGLYLAVEGVEEAFLKRNYGFGYGKLYKPDSLSFGGGRGNGRDFDMGDFDFNFEGDSSGSSGSFGSGNAPGSFDPSSMPGGVMPDIPSSGGGMPDMPSSGGEIPDMPSSGNEMPNMPPSGNSEIPGGFDSSDLPGDFDPSAIPGDGGGKNGGFNFGGGSGMGSSDVKLQYIDDDPASYENIWNNAKTDITKADQSRLIESLKKLSDGEDIESIVDTLQVIRYFVVHNYVCNDDSYTGMMVHNYYLYEKDGQLAMIPWDYNLGFGTFSAGDATSTVNTPIDSPVSGGSSDRPMLNWIFEDEEYTNLYHQYFSEFLKTVDIAGMIEDAYNLIRPYVQKDPTAFYTYDEFELGVKTLRQFCNLRSESISMQIENGETSSKMNYVDASAITLSDMGSMGGGKGGFGGGPQTPQNPGQDAEHAGGTSAKQSVNAIATSTSDKTTDDLPGDFPGGFPGQFAGSQPESTLSTAPGTTPETTPSGGSDTTPEATPSGGAGEGSDIKRPSGGNMQKPGGDFSFDMNGMGTSSSELAGWIWIGVSVAILIAGLIVAKKYKT